MLSRRALASLLTLSAGACTPNPAFQLAGADESSAGTSAATAAVVLSSGTGSDTSPATSDAVTTSGLAATGDSSDAEAGTTAAFDGPTSCAGARDLGLKTGLTEIADPNRPGAAISVWCEQDIADGGWMLVGRSAENAEAINFGWNHDLGDPQLDGEPYSLDAVSLGLPMTQILVGAHDGGNRPARNIYALTVADDFLTAHADTPAAVTTVFTVLGECAPLGGPTMLRWAGYTAANDRFRLRDLPGPQNDSFGLRIDALHLNYDDCLQAADLNHQQGVLFVR